MANLIGQSIGRYHILEQLGEGGMATVYKAYDTRLERDVAIKVIRRNAFPAEQHELILTRFEREAKALAKLNHPNIIGVIDYGEYENSPYLVMPYFPGGMFKKHLGEPIPWQDAVRLLLPIARALQFAHGQGIIHRDVKPSNILITLSGEPMLSDFGIAKILGKEETTGLTGTGVTIGTPEYMAPEQAMGREIDVRADIYSLGVVLYEMVTGRVPFRADTPPAILLKKITDPLPQPQHFVADLPDAVDRAIVKALEKDPENRYPNMEAFTSRLEKLSGETGKEILGTSISRTQLATFSREAGATPSSKTSISQQERKKRSWVLPVGMGAFILILVCLIVVLFFPFKNNLFGKEQPVATNTITPQSPTSLPTETIPPIISSEIPPTLAPQFDPQDPEGFIRWYFYSICTDRNYEYLWDYLSDDFKERVNPGGLSDYVKTWESVGRVEVTNITLENKEGNFLSYRVQFVTYSRKSGIRDQQSVKYTLYFNSQKDHWEFK